MKINQLHSSKFIHAKNAGKKNSNCYLFICEGDSAMNFIKSMLNGDNSNYGYIALQGKIMNFRKASIEEISKCKIFELIKYVLNLHNDDKKP